MPDPGWVGASIAKGETAKQVLARRLHGRTIVPRRWVAEKSVMDYETGLSQALIWVESTRAPAVMEMKKRLANCHL